MQPSNPSPILKMFDPGNRYAPNPAGGGGGGGAKKPVGYFWRGANGNVYVQGENGINSAGVWDDRTANYWGSKGFVQTADSPTAAAGATAAAAAGGGTSAPEKVLDTAQLASLDSLLGTLDTERNQTKGKAALTRDARLNEKDEEKKREKGKYDGKKLNTLQDFSEAKTDTDINTRNTLENLMSSLSTLGLGGSRALTRQILDAANMSNRKANSTQATNNRDLDGSFNDYTVGNENDVKKINDQYGFDAGEADKKFYQGRQNALYKKADVYNATDNNAAERAALMQEGDSLNGLVAGASFMNPSYTGKTREMATPDLANYTQDIAKYDTTTIGAGVGGNGTAAPGNLAVRAIAVNDKDLGIKKKTEAELGYGV